MGHPDGQNYALWRGTDFFASQSAAISTANPINAQGLITNFASLVVRAIPITSHGVTVTVNFYTDQTASILTEQYIWNVAASVILDVTIPAKGNFVKVSMTTTDAVASNMPVAVFPTNNPVSRITYDDQGNSAGNLLFSLGAGITQSFIVPRIVAGRGYVYVQDVASSAKISYTVATIDVNSAVKNNIVAVAQPLVISQLEFDAPDLPLVLRVTNNDGAAAHNASAYVSVIDR